MKIAVCIKRIPATDTKIRIKDDGTLDESGIQWITSPYDEYAVEMALRLAEAKGKTEVIVVCLGPDGAAERIRGELARGAERAIHIVDTDSRRDSLSVAQELAAVLKTEKPDIVFCGRAAADDQSFAVGPMLAVLLDSALVTEVTNAEFKGEALVAHKEADGSVAEIEVSLPAVLTATKAAFEPRFAKLKDIMAAKKKKLDAKKPGASTSTATTLSWAPPPPPAAGRVLDGGVDAVPELLRILVEDEKLLAL